MPHVVAYCSATRNKTVSVPTCKSFKDVQRLVADPLIKPKLEFFVAIARQIEPFLKIYQTDAPMLPFLSTDLGLLVKELLSRFVKEEIVEQCTSVASLMAIDFADKKKPQGPQQV